MAQTPRVKVKVPFTRSNAKECICFDCPVQADSSCVKANTERVGDVMSTKLFQPRILPALYCSSGVASCGDINTDRACICGGCPVYSEYDLGTGQPMDHYCRDGAAQP